jgi:hypothetical protein
MQAVHDQAYSTSIKDRCFVHHKAKEMGRVSPDNDLVVLELDRHL